jgi:hypothetical protein
MSRAIIALIIGCLVAGSGADQVFASSRGGDSTSDFSTKPKKGKRPAHHETVITSATATSLTIKEDKTEKSFVISPFTEITVDGQKATAADLKPGMFVSVTFTDATRLSRITATSK